MNIQLKRLFYPILLLSSLFPLTILANGYIHVVNSTTTNVFAISAFAGMGSNSNDCPVSGSPSCPEWGEGGFDFYSSDSCDVMPDSEITYVQTTDSGNANGCVYVSDASTKLTCALSYHYSTGGDLYVDPVSCQSNASAQMTAAIERLNSNTMQITPAVIPVQAGE